MVMLVVGMVAVFVIVVVTMLMVVIVAMVVIVSVPVIMVMVMIVPVIVRLAELMDLPAVSHLAVLVPAAVRASLGLECGFYMRDLRAEALEHFLEHSIDCDPEIAIGNFDRHVPVAKVVRRASERPRVVAFDMHKLFDFGNHFDDSSIRCGHEIASTEDLAARQHQRDLLARHKLRMQPAPLALVERQAQRALHLQRVCGARDFQLRLDFQHGRILSLYKVSDTVNQSPNPPGATAMAGL